MTSAPLLAGKRALVTGGSRGLGRALCRVLAEAGARVAFSYSRGDEAARESLAGIEAAGREGKSFKVSVLDEPGTSAMVKSIEDAWGAVDILINNAAVTQNLPLALLDEEDFDHVMDINVKGTYLTSRSVLRGMIRRKSGVILNMGSLAGMRALEAPIHYCTSKAAIVGMTEAMSKEVARHGIRVLCLAPGLLEDGVGRNLPEHRLADYLRHCSLGRVGTFDEVARFAAFLVSDRNSYMNGETIVMDGGV
ncbi:MAG: SDR family oxidoreductase [Byssovorax sp.]